MMLALAGLPIATGAEPLAGAPAATGVATLPLRVVVGKTGATSLPLRVSVVDADIASGLETVADGGMVAAYWGVRVEIGGADVSADVVGEIVVEAEENAARIADLSLTLAAGTPIMPATWVGRSVWIYLTDGAGGNAMPLFFGVVDLPKVELTERRLALRCTDNRQGVIGGMTRAEITALLPGTRHSPVVFDDGAGALAYANDRLSTLPVALDLSPTGALRVTPWAARTLPDLSFDFDQVLDGSLSVDVAERSALTNLVEIDFGYRFPRIKSEGYQIDYDYLALNATSFVYWVRDGNTFLQRAAVEAAIEAAGGTIVSVSWIALPTTAQVIPGTGGDPAGAWLPNELTDVQFCLGFSAVVSFDYAQQTEETHQIAVACAGSIAAVGAVRSTMSGALEGVYDDPTAVEQNILLYRGKVTTIPPKNLAPVVVGLTNSVTGTLTADTNRAAAEAAMETLIDIAGTEIFASHRRNTVSASVPCNPVLDVNKTVAIDAAGVLAKGKARRVVHRLDHAAGTAISAVDLAISSIAGVGFPHTGDTVAAPAGTSAGTSNTLGAPTVTWDGTVGGTNVITVTFPGVEEAERAKAAHTIASSFAAAIIEDVFEVTSP